jgi:hypothetical protein
MFTDDLFSPTLVFDKPDDGGADNPDGDGDDTGANLESIEEYKDALSKARKDAAKQRTKRKELESKYEELKPVKDKFEKFQQVFGDEDDADPEKLKQQTESLQSQVKTERVKNQLIIQAMEQDADPDLTIAYLQNKGTLSDLDPSDAESISQAVENALEEKENLKRNSKAVTTGDSEKDKGNEKTDLNSWIHSQAAKK